MRWLVQDTVFKSRRDLLVIEESLIFFEFISTLTDRYLSILSSRDVCTLTASLFICDHKVSPSAMWTSWITTREKFSADGLYLWSCSNQHGLLPNSDRAASLSRTDFLRCGDPMWEHATDLAETLSDLYDGQSITLCHKQWGSWCASDLRAGVGHCIHESPLQPVSRGMWVT